MFLAVVGWRGRRAGSCPVAAATTPHALECPCSAAPQSRPAASSSANATPTWGSGQSFFTTWPFLVVTLQQGSDLRGRPHAQTISYPFQPHRGLAPQTRGDSNLLRITLAAALEIRRGLAQSDQLLLGNPLGLGAGLNSSIAVIEEYWSTCCRW